jgi:hypothetical protein
VTMIALNVFLFRGQLNRIGLALLILLTWTFNQQNPYIIHEPQPMALLMLISFFCLPLNDKYNFEKVYMSLLLLFLGIYYFLAGYKKLPDPLWLKGDALTQIMQWDIVAQNITFNRWLIQILPGILFKFTNYAVLIFELTFFFFVFTKWKKYLIPIGLCFHILIFMFLDVGSFSQLMLVWYALL